MSELKAYPEYKDSGVEWIGEIPRRWNVSKLKYLASIETGNTPPKSDENNYIDGIYPWVKPDNINDDYTISDTKEKLSEQGVKLARLIPENSALVCCIGTVGKVGVNNTKVTTNQQINSIIFNKKLWNSIYGLYSTISAQQEYIKNSNKVVVSILNKNTQENIKMPLPSEKEQEKIGEFIKVKTSEIDNLIADKERLIELLEEKRQAVITETVTKGLDPNVKMKDSRIEWIGEVPEHWEFVKLKRFLKVLNGKEIEVELPLDNPNSIDVYGSGGVFKKTNEYIYNGESVLFGRKGTIGKPLYVNDSFWTVDTMYYTYFFEYSFPKWFYYVFLIFPWTLHTTNTALPSIVGADIVNEHWAIPEYKEQKEIAEYLDQVMIKINDLLVDINQQISKLKEYRESLIYEAVTGKIDVRDYATEKEQSY